MMEQFARDISDYSVHITHVEPLDARIVKFRLSIRLPENSKLVPNALLSLYEDMVLSGTQRMSKEAIDSYLRKYGLDLSITAVNGCIHFTMTAMPHTFTQGLSLISLIIRESRWTAREFTTKQHTALETNREAHDDARHIASVAWNNLVYPVGSRLRKETLKEERGLIERSSLPRLREIHSNLINGEWFATVVGDTKAERVARRFIQNLKPQSTPVAVPQEFLESIASQSFITVPGKTNVEVRVGNVLPIIARDDDFIPLSFGIAVLGKPGFSSRLMSTVREKEGLTYGIYTAMSAETTTSTTDWFIYTFFTAKDLSRGLAATHREIVRLVERGITARELSVFQEILRNELLITLGSNERRARFYHALALRGETLVEFAHNTARYESLTVHEVNRALKRYIDPQKLAIAGAGPVTPNGKGILL